MTINKKSIITDLRENDNKTEINQSKIKITRNPIRKPKKSIIRISFYNYGTEGIKWYSLFKIIKSH